MNETAQIIQKLTGMLIPIAGMLLPIAIIWMVMRNRLAQQRERNALILQWLDRNLPVPEALLQPVSEPERRKPMASPLRIGMTLIGLGLGLILLFVAMGNDMVSLWGIGSVPLCIGLAQLIVWRIEREDARRSQAEASAGAAQLADEQ